MADKPLTLVFAAVAACVAVFAGWRGALPSQPVKGPRMIPWRWIMLLATAAGILLLVHYLQLIHPYAAS